MAKNRRNSRLGGEKKKRSLQNRQAGNHVTLIGTVIVEENVHEDTE